MTPMREKFLQKRQEEAGRTFAFNPIKDRFEVTHHGFTFEVKSPCYVCPIHGITETLCSC